MSNKAKISIFFSAVSLIASLVIAGGVVLAWFASNETVSANSNSISVVTKTDEGFKLSFEDGSSIEETPSLFPEDHIDIRLSVTGDCSTVRIRFSVIKLKTAEFNTFFLSRPDLLLGQYQEEITLDSGAVTDYREFDIDKVAATAAAKKDFLKEFTDNNSLVSAIGVKVGKVVPGSPDWEAEPTTITVGQGDITEDPDIETDDNYFDVPLGYTLKEENGDELRVRIEYGLNGFLPILENYDIDGAGDLPANGYRVQNLNCFIRQKLAISFKSE